MIANTEDNLKSFLKLSNEYVSISTKALGSLELKMWTVDIQQLASHRRHKPREECERLMHQEEAS